MAFYDGFYATSVAGTGHCAAHFRRSRFLLTDKNCQLGALRLGNLLYAERRKD